MSRALQYLRRSRLTRNSGQIAVEYVLLLAISVSIAVMITSLFASRNPESPGLIPSKWRQVIEVIGKDKIEQ